MDKKQKLAHPLYGIVTEEYAAGRKAPEVARRMIGAGVRIIQYREKDKPRRGRYRDCLELRRLTADGGVTFIVNDDADIALAVGADGVHVGQDDMPLEAVRALAGNDMIVGVSTHSPSQALEAVAGGADYIGVGPLYPTKTKKDVVEAVGLGYLEWTVRNVSLPLVAIGGIKAHNLPDVLARGARCVALVTDIIAAPSIEEKIKELLAIVDSRKIR